MTKTSRAETLGGREVILEFIPAGGAVRVAAIDAATGVEAVVMGPARAARADLERLALTKLARALERDERARKHDPRGGRRV